MKLLFDQNLSPQLLDCWRICFLKVFTYERLVCEMKQIRKYGHMREKMVLQLFPKIQIFKQEVFYTVIHQNLYGFESAIVP